MHNFAVLIFCVWGSMKLIPTIFFRQCYCLILCLKAAYVFTFPVICCYAYVESTYDKACIMYIIYFFISAG
jgi:hypothetical protein